MYELDIVPMRDKAGVIIKGFDGPQRTFDGTVKSLYDFYAREGKVFVPSNATDKFYVGQRYKHKVFTGEMPEYKDGKMISTSPMHGFVNTEYKGERLHVQNYSDWDFAYNISRWKDAHFLIFFDLVEKELLTRMQERDRFVSFMRH